MLIVCVTHIMYCYILFIHVFSKTDTQYVTGLLIWICICAPHVLFKPYQCLLYGTENRNNVIYLI